MIRVNLDSIEVRFDGYTVKTHMSRRYQEQQCGLCGHFDGEVYFLKLDIFKTC